MHYVEALKEYSGYYDRILLEINAEIEVSGMSNELQNRLIRYTNANSSAQELITNYEKNIRGNLSHGSSTNH